MSKQSEELREARKQWFAPMEQKLKESWSSEEDSLFYYHSSEERIVLSHALFWTMMLPQFFKSRLRKEKFFLLLRQYQEEMLDTFLQDDDYFSDLLHYCNILYEMLPTILMSSYLRDEKDARKLAAISIVAAGYGGDMDEELGCQRDRSVASAYQTALKKKDDIAIALALSPFARKTAELVKSGAYEAAAGSCYIIFRCLAKTCKEHEDWYAGFTGYGDSYTKLAIYARGTGQWHQLKLRV